MSAIAEYLHHRNLSIRRDSGAENELFSGFFSNCECGWGKPGSITVNLLKCHEYQMFSYSKLLGAIGSTHKWNSRQICLAN